MDKPQTERVQGLAGKLNLSGRGGFIDVLFFSGQRVPAQSGLNADLIAFAGDQTDFDQTLPIKFFEYAVMADGFFSPWIKAFRAMLFKRFLIPDQMVAPRSRFRPRASINDGEVDALSLAPFKLRFQVLLCLVCFGKKN